MSAELKEVPQAPYKLDLGCGKTKREGFLGVDQREFPGVDVVADLTKPWPWEADSVEEINMSHCLEHFDALERVHIFNEMHRVMKQGAKATIITPYWCSNRAYGDFTHKFPAVSEMLYFYLKKEWRDVNAPDNDIEWNSQGYSCDFDATWGYNLHPSIIPRNQEYQMHALTFWKEAAQDLIATIVKR